MLCLKLWYRQSHTKNLTKMRPEWILYFQNVFLCIILNVEITISLHLWCEVNTMQHLDFRLRYRIAYVVHCYASLFLHFACTSASSNSQVNWGGHSQFAHPTFTEGCSRNWWKSDKFYWSWRGRSRLGEQSTSTTLDKYVVFFTDNSNKCPATSTSISSLSSSSESSKLSDPQVIKASTGINCWLCYTRCSGWILELHNLFPVALSWTLCAALEHGKSCFCMVTKATRSSCSVSILQLHKST